MKFIGDQIKIKRDIFVNHVSKLIMDLNIDEDAYLYYNFPLYRGDTPDELVQAQLMLISPIYGVLYFKCLDTNRNLSDQEVESMENLDASIFDRLIKKPELREGRRNLKINVTPYIVLPAACKEPREVDGFTYIIEKQIETVIKNNKGTKLSEDEYRALISSIDGTSRLQTKKVRTVENPQNVTKAVILNEIQNQEAVFDEEQKKAALVTIDGPQRIRGLAGSGKTILLSMKAAQYHLSHPDEEIVYTYYTKDLYGLIKNLIERFYRDFSDNREPNWKKIHILHGWGGSGLAGVYSTACSDNGIQPITFRTALQVYPKDPFDYVCNKILGEEIKPKYGLTLIDEGQDFPPHFYQLCYRLSIEKRIVWAYDEFQNIFDVALQDEKETFGKDKNGNYYVDFSKSDNPYQDIVLHVCYRNPRIVLICAFSLGLGIYNDKVLQRLEDNKQWESLGFKVEEGDSSDGCKMKVSRPIENTPNVLNDKFKTSSVSIQICDNWKNECSFVALKISEDIQKQNLRPDDICVICLDSTNIKKYYLHLTNLLYTKGIMTFNLFDAPYANTHFSQEGKVTLSTINKAKGNEKGMVYIMGADRTFANPNDVIERNKLFTAMTRSKGWVMITGEESLNEAIKELNKLKDNNYELVFTQPSRETTKTIEDVSRKGQSSMHNFLAEIQNLKDNGYSTDELMKLIAKNE